MISSLAVVSVAFVSVFMSPGLCCLPKEYAAVDGQCCPMCHEGHGLFALQGCTATADTVCDVVDGYFCWELTEDSGCSSAKKHTRCGPGHSTQDPGVAFVSVFVSPGLCCLPKEYAAVDGQCCPMCHEGTVVRKDCTLKSGTRCISCVNGTFMNQPNGLTKCFPCSPCDRGHGLFALQGCTATADTVCDVVDGYFCWELTEDSGCSSAKKHTRCGPGHSTQDPGTRRTDTVCESCPSGYFSVAGVNCTVWTTCSQTQGKKKEGSTISDVVCGAASRHYYSYIAVILPFITVVGLVIRGIYHRKKHDSPRMLAPCANVCL